MSTDNAEYLTPPAPLQITLAAIFILFLGELKRSYGPWKIWGSVPVSFMDIVWRSSMINSLTNSIMTRKKVTSLMVSLKFFNGDGVLGIFQEVGLTTSVFPYWPWRPPSRSCPAQYTPTSTSPAVTTALFNLAGITYNNHPFHTRHNDRHGPYSTRVGRTQERSWMPYTIGDDWHIWGQIGRASCRERV